MKRLLLPLIILAAIASAPAADFAEVSLTIPGPYQHPYRKLPTPVPAGDLDKELANPLDLHWTYLYTDTFGKGAATFEYKAQKYAIKPLFQKGHYDEKKGTYISNPAVFLVRVTDINKKIAPEKWMDLNLIIDFPFATLSGDWLKIKNANGTLSVIPYVAPEPAPLLSITHAQLFQLWAENANNFRRTINGKQVYLVPQMSWGKDGVTNLGFVASRGEHLVPEGRPLDFIALVHVKDGISFKPITYSIPLGLKFIYIGSQEAEGDENVFHWRIEEMQNEDLYEALDDEALESSLNLQLYK